MPSFFKRFDVRVSLAYGLIAALWIILSDLFAFLLWHDNPAFETTISVFKGLGFVSITMLGLFLVLSVELRRRQRLEDNLRLEIQKHEQTEASLQKMSRLYQLLSDGNQTLVRASNEMELLQALCQLLVKEGGYRFAWVGYVDLSPEKPINVMVSVGEENEYLQRIKITWSDTEWGQGPTGKAIRSGQPSTTRFILTDPDYIMWRDEAVQRGFASSTALPIKVNEQVIGALNLYSAREDAFDTAETTLLTELAEDLGYGIWALRNTQENQHVRQMLERERDISPAAILITNTDGQITYVNNEVERIVKQPRSLLLGQRYSELFLNPSDFEGNPIPFWNFNSTRVPPSREPHFGVQRAVTLQDGSRVFLELNATTLFDAAQNFMGFIVTFSDVTRQKIDEKRLRDSEESFRLLFLTNPHPMWVFHAQTLAFMEVNNAVVRHYGYSRDEFLSMRLPDIRPEEDLPAFYQVINEPRPDLNHVVDVRHRLKDGRLIDVELTTHNFEYAGQEAVLVVVQDVTDRKKSEFELRLKSAALDSAANGVVITDTRGIIEWINPAFTTLTGYTLDEAVGRNQRDLINSGQHEAAFYKELWTTILAGNVWHGELINRRKDGSIYTEEQTITPLRNTAGRITHFIGIKQDVSERKKAEEAMHQLNAELEARVAERTTQLSQIKNRIESILNSNADPIIFCHPDGGIEQVNPAFTDTFGYLLDDIIRSPVRQLVSADDMDVMEAAFIRVVKDRHPQSIDVTVCKQDGQAFDASIMLSPVIEQQERLLGVVLSVHDITQRSRMLRHAMDLSEVKSRYVSMAAHDLRNPMAVILTASDTLERYYQRLPEDKREAKFVQIRNSIKVMTDILDDVLLMGQAESGKLDFSPAPLDLAAFCQMLVNEAIQATSTVIHIAYLHHNLPDTVLMDAKLLRHILSNLLSNALKYSAESNTVNFEVLSYGEQIEFRIQDFGIGIPVEEQAHLFEAFYRASNAKQIRGTGLGLAIVKQSVEIHGGTITFRSEAGRGTIFTVMLPSVVPSS